MSKEIVVLAYSGGLDTSCILAWLIEKGYDVIAFLANLGQEEDFDAAIEKGKKVGAKEVVVMDLRTDLLEDFAWPAIMANLIYEDRYLMGTALARPCIVRAMVQIADKYNAGYISHGSTGKGNDQVRFELGVYALRPSLKIIAPWKDESFYKRFPGRTELFEFAKKHQIPLPVSPKSPWSIDGNILHVSYEAGVLENPDAIAPPKIYQMTTDPERAPDVPAIVTIAFEQGVPVSIVEGSNYNEKLHGKLDSLRIIEKANELGSLHGIGRIDIVENRFIGLKSRGLYESPGLSILRHAHLDLEVLCMDKETRRVKSILSSEMARMVYNGFWFSPECQYVHKCVTESQKDVSGNVTLKLFKGHVTVLRRSSPTSLYNQELVSMDVQGNYEPSDAVGFIKINAVRLQEFQRVKSQSNEVH